MIQKDMGAELVQVFSYLRTITYAKDPVHYRDIFFLKPTDYSLQVMNQEVLFKQGENGFDLCTDLFSEHKPTLYKALSDHQVIDDFSTVPFIPRYHQNAIDRLIQKYPSLTIYTIQYYGMSQERFNENLNTNRTRLYIPLRIPVFINDENVPCSPQEEVLRTFIYEVVEKLIPSNWERVVWINALHRSHAKEPYKLAHDILLQYGGSQESLKVFKQQLKINSCGF